MANQLKKKFVGDDQIDGSKILLEQGQSIKAKDALGVEQDLIKLGPSDEVLVGPLDVEVALKGESVQKAGDTMEGDLVMDFGNAGISTTISDGTITVVNADAQTLIGADDISVSSVAGSINASGNMYSGNIELSASHSISGDNGNATFAVSPNNSSITQSVSDSVNQFNATSTLDMAALDFSFLNQATGMQSTTSYQHNIISVQQNDGTNSSGFVVTPGVSVDFYANGAAVTPTADSHLAPKKYVDDEVAAVADDVSHLVTLSGVAVDSDNLGSFLGTTIADDQTIKQALQALETAVEAVSGGGSSTQTELDDTQLGAGLEIDGSYVAPAGSNYLTAAVSLKDADSKLDVQIKTNSDDIADLVSEDLLFLKLDGSRPMEASLNMMNGLVHNKIVGLADPTDPRDAVNKQYVDAIAEGLHVHAPAKALFAASLASVSGGSVTYSNGSSGEGATLSLANPITAIDGYTLQIGDRVIINGESNQAHNGIYLYSSSTLFTRASDFDSTIEAAGGDFIFVQEGTAYGNSGWVMTETTSAIGTSPIIFVQFSGAGQLSEGDAIDLNGNEINVLYDNSSIGVNGSNQLFVKTDGISNAMLQDDSVDKSNIAADVAGIGLQQAVDGSLEIKLDGSSLAVSASGIKSNIIWSKAYFDLSAADITNGYVDFPTGVIAEAGSIVGFVDRLAIHEDEDFTVSTVSGKTRIIFAGDLIAPGQSALDANDNLYFKFQKKEA
jgi:hypothetical protein